MEKYAIKEVQHLIINQIQTYLQLQNRNDPETTTPIQTVVISPTKTANLTFAEIGDNVTYTVTFTNQGTIPATGVTITDSLPPSTTFVTNSVTVNTIPQPVSARFQAFPSVQLTGEIVTVTFQVQINAIPPNGKIENTASVTYISQPTRRTTYYNNRNNPDCNITSSHC